jgi:predicted flap endonuclease-1-like 5' DNA nuclease
MNLILKVAKQILQDMSTVADVLADGKVTAAENLQMKLRGFTRQVNLKALVPESTESLADIPQFEDLTEDQLEVITDGKAVPEKFVKAAYDIAMAQYQLVSDLIAEDPDATVKLPDTAPDIELSQVPGVGAATVEILNTLGIKTVRQLANANIESLKEGFKQAGKAAPIVAKVGNFIEAAKKLLETS